MLRAKRFHYLDFVFVVLIAVLIAAILILISSDDSQNKQRKLIERSVYNSFVAALAQTKSNAILLFELQYNNEVILPLLDAANSTINDPKSLRTIKQKLHRQLHMQFQASSKTFVHQQIYLINGESLLHLDEPYVVNKTKNMANTGLDKVLQTQEISFGLALENGKFMYRYFFPIFNDINRFIAVVEVAIPVSAIQLMLMNANNVQSQYLFAKRPLLSLPQKSKLFKETAFSDSFVICLSAENEVDQLSYLNEADLEEVKFSLNTSEEAKLLQLKRFSINTQIAGQDGIAVFIPIHNDNGQGIGGIITFSPNTSLYLSKSNSDYITFILLFMFVSTLLYATKKSVYLYRIQRLHQRFLDAIPFPVFLKDEKAQYLSANKCFYHFFDIKNKQLLHKNRGFDSEPEMLRVSIDEINDAGGSLAFEYEEFKENKPITYKLVFYATSKKQDLPQGIIGHVQDISDTKSLNESLKESKFDQNQFMNLLPLGIRIFNLEGKVTFVNQAFEHLSGYNSDELLSTDCKSLFSCMQCNQSQCSLQKAIDQQQAYRIDTIKYNEQGEAGIYEVIYQPYYSTENIIQGVVEITADITANKSLLDKNHALILTDELTGLLNHRGIMSAGDNCFRLAKRGKKPLFVLYIVIDNLRKIYAEHGEEEGNTLLRSFVDILKETFRETDFLARIDGDEFVILMNDSEYKITDNAGFIRLDNNIKKFNEASHKEYRLVIDTGIVEYGIDNHADLLALISDAERLVYENKLKRTLI
ncbi:diguanylate cyclase [Psychromonas sp.]|nr:diguanylate cyclase [Psychromonas sp.]